MDGQLTNNNSKTVKTYKGAGVALFKKNDNESFVLLGRRRIKPCIDCWSFLGGGKHKNETFTQAALREFEEESGTSLDSSLITKQKEMDFNFPFFKWKTLLIETTQDIVLDKSCYSKEFFEVKWVNIKDIKKYKLHIFVKTVVNKYSRGI